MSIILSLLSLAPYAIRKDPAYPFANRKKATAFRFFFCCTCQILHGDIVRREEQSNHTQIKGALHKYHLISVASY